MATPGSITVVAGDYQEAIVNTYYHNTVRILARDTGGAIMPNEPMVFSLPVSGAGGVFAWSQTRTCYVTTGADGTCYAEQVSANGIAGTWLGAVQFVNALGINTVFHGTNLPVTPIAYSILSVSGINQKAAQNSAYAPFVVQVFDQYGNPWVGGSVTFSVTAGYGSFAGSASVTTDSSGIATSSVFTSNTTLGSFTITAQAPGAPKVDPTRATTWTTVNASLPTNLAIVSGNDQKVGPGLSFTSPLVARVYNALGAPLSGISVTFTAPGSGASCTFVGAAITQVVTTDASGNATSVTPKANANVGTYQISAAASGATSAYFSTTNGYIFLPEYCSVPTALTIGATQAPGGSIDWSNPNNAWNGNTTGTTLSTGNSFTNDLLYVYLLPTSILDEIHPQAKILRYIVGFEIRRSATQQFTNLFVADYTTARTPVLAGASISYAAAGTAYQPNSHSLTASNISGRAPIGTDVKNGQYGIVFTPAVYASNVNWYIRNCTLSVCYQNPDLSVPSTSAPLLLCEA